MNINEFTNPAKKYRPMVRWWWPGLEVEEEELRQEVRDLDKAGFGAAELQAFKIGSPSKMETDRAQRHHRFMHPYHYEMIAAVLDEAQKHGMTIDITQNSAWPTGGTHIPFEESFGTLIIQTKAIEGGSEQLIKIMPLKKPNVYKFLGILKKVVPVFDLMRYIPQDKRLTKVVAGKLLSKKGKIRYSKVKTPAKLDPASMIDLSDQIGPDNTIQWDAPEGMWQIFFCYEGSAGSQPLMDTRSAPDKDALVVDHFSRQAATNHLEAFIGQGEDYFGDHFGSTLRALFTDSFEHSSPMNWSANFLEEFEKRKGYDLTPYIPVIYVPLRDIGFWTYGHEVGLPCFDFPGDIGERIRYDYERTISDLYVDEFIKAVQGWSAEHGLLSRVQGYGFRADNLEMLGYSDIPETEQFYCGGMLHFMKMAGAAGTLYERSVVTAESLIWEGRSYMTTPLKWRVGADRLFESGVNQMIYQGLPYRHPGYPYPGFQPFASPEFTMFLFTGDFSRDAEFWPYFPTLNMYVSRMQHLMQETKTVAGIGIFYGLFDMPNGYYKREELTQGILDEDDGEYKSNRIVDMILGGNDAEGERLYVKEMAELGDDLVANGYYYLNFNRDRLLQAEVVDGKVIMGEAEFEALIFFKEMHLPFEIIGKLAELSEQGIPILFVESLPYRQSGFKDWENNDPIVKSTCKTISQKHQSLVNNADDVVPFLRSAGVEPQLRFDAPDPHIGFIHKRSRKNDEQFVMVRNRMKKLTTTQFLLPGVGLIPYELDAMRGEVYQVAYESHDDGNIHLTLPLEAYQSRVIGFASPDVVAQYPQRPQPPLSNQGELVQEIGDWQLNLSKRNVDGTHQTIQAIYQTPEDWRQHDELKICSGPADYEAEFELSEGSLEPDRQYYLDFARVCDVATVTLNDVEFAPLMLPPWQVNITKALKPGLNRIRVKVETTYRNLLVGYANDGSKLYKQYKKQTLMPSGLIGKIVIKKM